MPLKQIELLNLKAWCKKHHVDEAFIDKELTFNENKELLSVKTDSHYDPIADLERKVKYLGEKLLKEHQQSIRWQNKYLKLENRKLKRLILNG